MSSTGHPFISVVILIGAQRKRAEKALSSVLDQGQLDQAETLLLDTAYDKYPPIIGSDHAAVRVIDSTDATSYENHGMVNKDFTGTKFVGTAIQVFSAILLYKFGLISSAEFGTRI